MSHIPLNNIWQKTAIFSPDSGNSSSIYDVISKRMEIKFDILILKELELITKDEMKTLVKMLNSPDHENIVVLEQIIKQKMIDDEK